LKSHDAGREEKEIFASHLARHRLKRSEQREVILNVFLRSERHLSAEELLRLAQKVRSDIGRTTVYRTLKLLTAAGLARELALEGESRFERQYKRDHHDHYICNSCGIFEFASEEIERIQEETAAGIGFVIEGHHHQIYGICRKCAISRTRKTR
jgi:Fur family ferric uptake transcriptional regulator